MCRLKPLIGTDEDDTLTGRNGYFETIEGGDGSDILVGGAESDDPDRSPGEFGFGDTVSYEQSDRRVRVDLGNGSAATARVSGGHATGDTISGFENVRGSAHDDVLTGRSNIESVLWGLGGDDTLVGGPGWDIIEGGAGADELDGGSRVASWFNTLSYAGSDAGVTVNLATLSASGGHAEGDEIETIEYTVDKGNRDPADDEEIDLATFHSLIGSDHDDRLTGHLLGNTLRGGAGDDTLRGGADNDTLIGGPGADRLDGGTSTYFTEDFPDTDFDDRIEHEDWAVYWDAAAGVTVNLDTGRGTRGEALGDTLEDIELVWGSAHADTFIAGASADLVHGAGGSDTVSYEASKHGVSVTLNDGQYGDDPNTTGTEDDVFFAPTALVLRQWRRYDPTDTASTRPAPDPQADDGNVRTKSYAEGDVLASIENVTGSRDPDTLTGDDVPNVIKGGGGNDTLRGAGGNDTLHGGPGHDTLGDRTDLNGDGDSDDDREDAAFTELGNDRLYGDTGNDRLYGGAGNDTLHGGAGDDDLTGGAGVDTFVFEPGGGSDIITDFTEDGTDATANDDGANDRIDLSAFDLEAADLAGLISERAGNVIINLEDHGGGRIVVQDTTAEALGTAVLVDTNGDEPGIGDGEGASAGIFIL